MCFGIVVIKEKKAGGQERGEGGREVGREGGKEGSGKEGRMERREGKEGWKEGREAGCMPCKRETSMQFCIPSKLLFF